MSSEQICIDDDVDDDDDVVVSGLIPASGTPLIHLWSRQRSYMAASGTPLIPASCAKIAKGKLIIRKILYNIGRAYGTKADIR